MQHDSCTARKKFSHFKWTAEAESLLGTTSDSAIAQRLGINASAVLARRRKLDIAAYTSPVDADKEKVWTQDVISRLGIQSDASIARELDLFQATVSNKRNALGIAPLAAKPWITEALISMLGTAPDDAIAKEFNVSATSVRRLRRTREIPSFTEKKALEVESVWEASSLALLGKMSDVRIAESLGITIFAVFKKRNDLGIKTCQEQLDEAVIPLLGTMPDKHVAEMFGLSPIALNFKRKALSISAFRPQITLPAELIPLLGTASDGSLARKFGVKASAVFARRKAKGILAFAKR